MDYHRFQISISIKFIISKSILHRHNFVFRKSKTENNNLNANLINY